MSTLYTPQSHYQITPRTLHIYSGHSSHLEILDKTTVLYTVYRSSSDSTKPHLTIVRPEQQHLVGAATFHGFSSHIDIDLAVPSQPLTMTRAGWLSSAYAVTGGPGIQDWRWERDGAMTRDVRLVDGMGSGVLARFENASSSSSSQKKKKKEEKLLVGRLMILGNPNPSMLDAIVVTGCAKIEDQMRR